MRPGKEAGTAKMAAERSRSPVGGSPVPASMFAPEPVAHGGTVAAFSRPHGGVPETDCTEDGELLNGEPELDLTSKVGLAGLLGTRAETAGGGEVGCDYSGSRSFGRLSRSLERFPLLPAAPGRSLF